MDGYNKLIMKIIHNPIDYKTTENEWWFVVDEKTNASLTSPLQCIGSTSTQHTLVVCNSLEECSEYMHTNNIQELAEIS